MVFAVTNEIIEEMPSKILMWWVNGQNNELLNLKEYEELQTESLLPKSDHFIKAVSSVYFDIGNNLQIC